MRLGVEGRCSSRKGGDGCLLILLPSKPSGLVFFQFTKNAVRPIKCVCCSVCTVCVCACVPPLFLSRYFSAKSMPISGMRRAPVLSAHPDASRFMR
jgi:hypothetical protein